ncbi:MAG: ribonuclease P protein component [Clostridiales bacterium]|nr:ribonuclease P protein component [Clostridiales bacterium]
MNRSYSLKRHKEFRFTYRVGKHTGGRLFALVFAKNRLRKLQVGLSASKKLGGSVQRNRAKRRIRACLHPLLPNIRTGYNLVVVLREGVLTEPFPSLMREMENQLKRAGLWVEKP